MNHTTRFLLYLVAALTAVSASADEAPSIEGRWYSYYGVLEIERAGDEVEGTYSCCRGEIRGKLTGRRVEFTWKDAVYGEGWGYFRVEGNGNRLEGEWGRQDDIDASGEWGAVRMDEPAADGPLERFRVVDDHPRFGPLRDGEAVFAFHGKTVEGRLFGYYMTEFQEKPYRVDVFLYLDGKAEDGGYELEWEDPRYGHFGAIHLNAGGESTVLRGEWEPFGAAGTKSAIHFEKPE